VLSVLLSRQQNEIMLLSYARNALYRRMAQGIVVSAANGAVMQYTFSSWRSAREAMPGLVCFALFVAVLS